MSEENNDSNITNNDSSTVTSNDAGTTDWTDPNIRITVIERGLTNTNLEKNIIEETKKD